MTKGSDWNTGRRNGAAVVICLLANAARASAGDPVVGRHSHRLSGASRPAGVPADYVLTHHGWFHPSCVINVVSDETVGADLVIRGRDGTAHATFAPCVQMRYDRRGRRVAPPANGQVVATQKLVASPPAPVIYDGYIVFYVSNGAIAPGSTLTTDWIVPPAPTNVSNQDIAFFNDILTSAGGGDILQPVLDFNGAIPGKWSIESEHCCLSGNDMKTIPIVVTPGDLIRGTVAGTGCAATGVCQSWTVTTTDVTTGESTTLNTTAPNGVPNGVSPAALETYGVTSCDMFPSGGATTFTNNSLTGPDSAVQTRKYDLLILARVDAEVPTDCGYTGKASGNDYTLIYGNVTVGIDGGTADGGGTQDALADDGATGSGGAKGTGGDGAMGTSGTIGGSGGSPGSGGRSLADAGAVVAGGSRAGTGSAGADGGCSCSTASGSDAPPGVVLAVAWLLAVTSMQRRRRSTRRVR